MPNIRTGELAYIKSNMPELNGVVVSCIREAYHFERFTSVDGTRVKLDMTEKTWVVSNGRVLPWYMSKGVLQGRIYFFIEVPILDRNLIPIRKQDDDAIDEMVKIVGKAPVIEKLYV